jgi:peptidylprolyl isomerase
MTQARPGDTVRIHYTGRFTDGVEFDSSTGRPPLEFRIGAGQIISGLEDAVAGMSVGETSTVTIPPEKGYGPHHAEAVRAIPRDTVPPHVELEPGVRLQAQRPDGMTIPLTVVAVDEAEVTVDANHPLAGRDLVFDVELVEVV